MDLQNHIKQFRAQQEESAQASKVKAEDRKKRIYRFAFEFDDWAAKILISGLDSRIAVLKEVDVKAERSEEDELLDTDNGKRSVRRKVDFIVYGPGGTRPSKLSFRFNMDTAPNTVAIYNNGEIGRYLSPSDLPKASVEAFVDNFVKNLFR